jgi:hypothetical protein
MNNKTSAIVGQQECVGNGWKLVGHGRKIVE